MERLVKGWLVLAIFVMAFLTGHVTEGIRDVPNSTKEEVYKPELLGGLLGPAWGSGVVPAILLAIWPIAFLDLCCGGIGPGWIASNKDIPHHKGDADGGYKPPNEGESKGDYAGGYEPPDEGDAGGGYKAPNEGEPNCDAAGGYKPQRKVRQKGMTGMGLSWLAAVPLARFHDRIIN